MLKNNDQITLSWKEAISILKEIEFILISLHKIGAFYIDKDKAKYEKETTCFIDEHKITHRLASVRSILVNKFDLGLGDDDMDDVERAMESIKLWAPSD